ncbi:hypothetical protein OR16_40914 [Cupriavidus basilensis OR16]|uniref:Uncharacterized protein n=1 Tax=Cupriavidus basilensis OR16 TaxID=1127483 RepID=H1SI68_9BURK|nr:hypothetical protein OR16_40914 [Cupriavidus basilensis OR16]
MPAGMTAAAQANGIRPWRHGKHRARRLCKNTCAPPGSQPIDYADARSPAAFIGVGEGDRLVNPGGRAAALPDGSAAQ